MENAALVNNLTNILNGLDDSQEKLEKDAFDVINSSDTSLNLVRESIGSVEEILKMIDTLNAVVEESSAKIQKLEKLSADIEQFASVIASMESFSVPPADIAIFFPSKSSMVFRPELFNTKTLCASV